jgi:hypothetical protein
MAQVNTDFERVQDLFDLAAVAAGGYPPKAEEVEQ